ncbi:MAG TPA: DUF2617 family protein [Pirellulales bacterium]
MTLHQGGTTVESIVRLLSENTQPDSCRSVEGPVAVLTVRPKIAELVFQLYGRPLHPELFQIYSTRTVARGEYDATIHITSAGHIVTWRYRGMTLTEVACSAAQVLPQKRRLFQYRLKGHRADKIRCRGGVNYHMSFQLEPVRPEVFWTYQHELASDGDRQGMLHRFDSSGRMALGALSYVNVETRNRSLLIQAFHTFPDDYAIVKSQSLFEVERADAIEQ